MLPGGKVKELEKSSAAIKRQIEEIRWKNKSYCRRNYRIDYGIKKIYSFFKTV